MNHALLAVTFVFFYHCIEFTDFSWCSSKYKEELICEQYDTLRAFCVIVLHLPNPDQAIIGPLKADRSKRLACKRIDDGLHYVSVNAYCPWYCPFYLFVYCLKTLGVLQAEKYAYDIVGVYCNMDAHRAADLLTDHGFFPEGWIPAGQLPMYEQLLHGLCDAVGLPQPSAICAAILHIRNQFGALNRL